MIADRCHACQRCKRVIQIPGILCFIAGSIYLVPCGEEEVDVHIVLDRIQRLVPSLNVLRCSSCSDLRVSHKGKAEG